MRSLLLCGVVMGVFIGVSQAAIADYFLPGRVIIGGGGIAPPPPTGGKAMAMADCPLPIECECFPNTPLIAACDLSGIPLECVLPDTPYFGIDQPELVLLEGQNKVLGELRCAGKSNATAFVDIGPQKP